MDEPSQPAAARDAPAPLRSPNRWATWLSHVRRVRGPIVVVAAIGTVLSGLLGYWNVYRAVVPAAAVIQAAAPTAAVSPLSIVVLPFINQTGDPQKAYLADGLTSSITADLARIRDAFIVPVATAIVYRDKAVPVSQVGQELGVRFVLQGGVQISANRVRVNAQLVDASSGAQRWSESFEGDLTDLFALQDQVTHRIGNSIGEQMVILAARESETRKIESTVADLMLKARALGLKPQSMQNFIDIEALNRRVLAADPGNSSAMIGLSVALLLQASNFKDFFNDDARGKLVAEGGLLAARAQALDPENPYVYAALSFHADGIGDRPAALRHAQRALELNPGSPRAYNNLAILYRDQVQPAKAIELLNKALALHPKGSDVLFTNLADSHFMLGNNEAAVAWALKATDTNTGLWGPYVTLAMAYAELGDEPRARAAAAEAHRRLPGLKPNSALNPDKSEAMREYFESRLLPAWKKAGLPLVK